MWGHHGPPLSCNLLLRGCRGPTLGTGGNDQHAWRAALVIPGPPRAGRGLSPFWKPGPPARLAPYLQSQLLLLREVSGSVSGGTWSSYSPDEAPIAPSP